MTAAARWGMFVGLWAATSLVRAAQPISGAEMCAGRLDGGRQTACLEALKNAAPAIALPVISRILLSSDGATGHTLVAGLLHLLRTFGKNGAPAGDTLSAMLSHRHPLYRDRDKSTVTRLRTYTLLTLSEIGVPASAVPALLDVLAHFDARMNAAEFGAAARAAGSLGPAGHRFVPYMLAALPEVMSEDEFTLVRYEAKFETHEATTVQLEVLRSLGRVALPEDGDAMRTLRRLAFPASEAGADARVTHAAREAIGRIGPRR